MTAIIAYDNINGDDARQFSGGTTTPNPDYPIQNAADYSTYNTAKFGAVGGVPDLFTAVFKSAMTIDYIALMRHNLPLTSTIEVATNAGAVHEVLTVDHAGPLLFMLATPYTSDGLKLTFDGPGLGEIEIGVLMYGVALPLPGGMPAGFTPPPMGRDTTTYPASSAGGQFLAAHVQRQGWEFKIPQRNVSPAWMESNWLDLVFHVERAPFIFSWDHSNRPEDTVYAWVAKKVGAPRYDNPLYMSWSLTCRGLHLE